MKNNKIFGIRAKQKEKTRRNVIDAAFNQLNAEQGFASLSLREVAREAGIAPTSFYRHFRDMDELGLAMVDESGLTLRQLLRQARKRIEKGGSVLQTSVTTFIEFIDNNPKIFLLLLREKAGTSSAFRSAIGREIQHFVIELVDYLNNANKLPHEYNHAQAHAMVLIAFNTGAEAIDLDVAKRQKLIDDLIFQLRMISKGAYYMYYKDQVKKDNISENTDQ